MKWWKNIFNKKEKQAAPGSTPFNQSTANASGQHSTSQDANYTSTRIREDLTEEEVFKLYTGFTENDFLSQSIAVRIEYATQHKASNPDIKEAFEGINYIKYLRHTISRLKERQQKIEEQFPFTWYADLVGKGSQPGTSATGNADNNPEAEIVPSLHPELLRHYKEKEEETNREIERLRKLQDGFWKKDVLNIAEGAAQVTGVREEGYKNFTQHIAIKEKRLAQVFKDAETYTIEKRQEHDDQAGRSYAAYFWKLLGIASLFLMLSFFNWYLLSPLDWTYLPLALLFSVLLVLIPPQGLKWLFRYIKDPENKNQQERITRIDDGKNNEGNTVLPATQKPANAKLLVAFDITIPLAVVCIILFLNWNTVALSLQQILLSSALFLFFLCIRVSTIWIVSGYPDVYREALSKTYTKRAFMKGYREHHKVLKREGLNNYTVKKELENFFNEQVNFISQVSIKVTDALDKEFAWKRNKQLEFIQQSIRDVEFTRNKYLNEQEPSPYGKTIPDIDTAERLLARLEILFDLASGMS